MMTLHRSCYHFLFAGEETSALTGKGISPGSYSLLITKLEFKQKYQAPEPVHQITGEDDLLKMWWYTYQLSPTPTHPHHVHGTRTAQGKEKLMAWDKKEHSNKPK